MNPNGLSSRLNHALEQQAWRVFNLSIDRVGIRYPLWARTSKMRKQFIKVYKKAAIKNYFKRCGAYQVDHIIPLHGQKVSGLHVPWNLHVIRTEFNQAKGVMRVPEYETKLPESVGHDRALPKWKPTLVGRRNASEGRRLLEDWDC